MLSTRIADNLMLICDYSSTTANTKFMVRIVANFSLPHWLSLIGFALLALASRQLSHAFLPQLNCVDFFFKQSCSLERIRSIRSHHWRRYSCAPEEITPKRTQINNMNIRIEIEINSVIHGFQEPLINIQTSRKVTRLMNNSNFYFAIPAFSLQSECSFLPSDSILSELLEEFVSLSNSVASRV